MSGSTKSSKAGFEKRVFTVQGWLIDGVPDYMIFKNISDNWGIGKRQARRYLKEAYTRWNTDSDATMEEKRQTRIAWLKNEVRTMPLDVKNTSQGKRTILQYLKEISKLENLYHSKRVELSGDPDKPLKLDTHIEAIEIVRIGT